MSRELQHARDRELGYLEMIGASPAIQAVLEQIEAGKDHDDNVLILGESGTGKELVARLFHRASGRSEKAFVAFDCSSVPEDILISELFGHERGAFTGAVQKQRGLVEKAEGGTLFLDEVGNLSLRVQTMLLRFLDHKQYRRLGTGEEKKADVRLMFATNSDLAALALKREFREDLFFRLKRGIVLRVPPLRERREDIPLLADFLLKKYNQERKTKISFSAEARTGMMSYAYPGNIRELEAFVYEAARAAHRMKQETIQHSHLPKELTGSESPTIEAAPSNLKLSAPDFYAKYLPKEFQDRHFIWGQTPEAETSVDDSDTTQQLHEQLLISIKAALGMPLKFATRAVVHAFERNVLLALLRQTRGKQNEAIKLARINKSAFINKMKRHGINLKKKTNLKKEKVNEACHAVVGKFRCVARRRARRPVSFVGSNRRRRYGPRFWGGARGRRI